MDDQGTWPVPLSAQDGTDARAFDRQMMDEIRSDPEVRRAQSTLSPDARLVLAALESKIERQMKRHHARSTAELKAFVTTELVRKERAAGPVELSPAQRRAVAAPVPEPRQDAPRQAPARRLEPEAPRRTLSR